MKNKLVIKGICILFPLLFSSCSPAKKVLNRNEAIEHFNTMGWYVASGDFVMPYSYLCMGKDNGFTSLKYVNQKNMTLCFVQQFDNGYLDYSIFTEDNNLILAKLDMNGSVTSKVYYQVESSLKNFQNLVSFSNCLLPNQFIINLYESTSYFVYYYAIDDSSFGQFTTFTRYTGSDFYADGGSYISSGQKFKNFSHIYENFLPVNIYTFTEERETSLTFAYDTKCDFSIPDIHDGSWEKKELPSFS